MYMISGVSETSHFNFIVITEQKQISGYGLNIDCLWKVPLHTTQSCLPTMLHKAKRVRKSVTMASICFVWCLKV